MDAAHCLWAVLCCAFWYKNISLCMLSLLDIPYVNQKDVLRYSDEPCFLATYHKISG